MKKQCWQKAVSELIGTFVLTFAVGASLASGSFPPVITPLVAGITLMLFVYTIGGISGCHINPAVTIGLAVGKKIDLKEAVAYLVFQFIGGFLALLAIGSLFGATGVSAASSGTVFLAEAIGMFVFVFGISAVVAGKVSQGASGIVIGGSLFLGILLAAAIGSNGVLNPAVAVGISSVSSAYFAGPVLGSILAVVVYKFLGCCGSCGEKCDTKK